MQCFFCLKNSAIFVTPYNCHTFASLQHTDVFVQVSEIFILVPSLLGLNGNLEMTLASRLSTQVSQFSL